MGIAFTYLLSITPIRPHEFENEVQNEDWGGLISSGPCHMCFEGVPVASSFFGFIISPQFASYSPSG